MLVNLLILHINFSLRIFLWPNILHCLCSQCLCFLGCHFPWKLLGLKAVNLKYFCLFLCLCFCVSLVANFLENCLVSRRSLWSIFASFFVFVSLWFLRCEFPWKLFGLKTVTLKPLYLNDQHLSHPSYNVRLTSSIRTHPHHWLSSLLVILIIGHHWSSLVILIIAPPLA